MRRNIIILIFVWGLFLGTSCVSEPQLPKQPRHFPLHTFSKSSVTVDVILHISADGVATLVGTYAPEEPSLHLYSLDLPMEGIDGVGRPTRLEIVSGALNTQGALVADVTAVNHTFPQFDAPFPLYPDGAVMLTLPVSVPTGAPETDEVELSISYMACSSDGGCKLPVTDHRVTVRLPAEIWQ